MQFTITTMLATAAMLVAPALGQNATASDSSDLTSLIDQLPGCAVGCLEQSAAAINCTSSDLPCLCDKSDQLVASIAPCVLTSSCNSTEQTRELQPSPTSPTSPACLRSWLTVSSLTVQSSPQSPKTSAAT